MGVDKVLALAAVAALFAWGVCAGIAKPLPMPVLGG